MEREPLLTKLSELDFAAFDMRLYLDTHPHDKKALDEYHAFVRQADSVRTEYEKNFGPLTAGSADGNYFDWIDEPWPWQNLKK